MIGRAAPLVNVSSRLFILPTSVRAHGWRLFEWAADAGLEEAEVGEQLQISRERVRQIENEALQKLRRLDGERLFADHQDL